MLGVSGGTATRSGSMSAAVACAGKTARSSRQTARAAAAYTPAATRAGVHSTPPVWHLVGGQSNGFSRVTATPSDRTPPLARCGELGALFAPTHHSGEEGAVDSGQL